MMPVSILRCFLRLTDYKRIGIRCPCMLNKYSLNKSFMPFSSQSGENGGDKVNGKHSNIIKSTAFVQDGSEIKEIPLVIRTLIPSLLSLNKTFSYSGETVRNLTEHEGKLMQSFQNSQSINELCRILAVPYNYITGYSAATALEKLCHLNSGDSLYVEESFVTRAILKELFVAVAKEAHTLDGLMLIKLIKCKFSHLDFEDECFKVLRSKFLEHLFNQAYSVPELLSYSRLLSQLDSSEEQAHLLGKIWEQIGARYPEISREMLTEVYSLVPKCCSSVFGMLEKTLRLQYIYLDFYDIFVISKAVQTNSDRKQELMLVSKWAQRHVNCITHGQLLGLLSNFINSKFSDSLLLSVISQYIPEQHKTDNLTVDVISSVLTYCIVTTHYDSVILDVACDHFVEHDKDYSAAQLGCVLRAFGVLNFTPSRHREFYSKVEKRLLDDFYKIDCLPLLDMMVSLVHVNRVPVNFQPFIFSPLFLGLVNEMTGEDHIESLCKLQLIEWAFKARGFRPLLTANYANMMHLKKEAVQKSPLTGSTSSHSKVLQALHDLGIGYIGVCARPTCEGLYYEICYDDKYNIITRTDNYLDKGNKLGLIFLSENSFCGNKKDHMLGTEATNIRILEEKGVEVVVLPERLLIHNFSRPRLVRVLRDLLSNYVTLRQPT